jgi:hypothetical protein
MRMKRERGSFREIARRIWTKRNPHEHKLSLPLGYCTAAMIWVREGMAATPFQNPRLSIVTGRITEDQTNSEAESVEIYGLDDLTALRDLLNQCIEIAHRGVSDEALVKAAEAIQKAEEGA